MIQNTVLKLPWQLSEQSHELALARLRKQRLRDLAFAWTEFESFQEMRHRQVQYPSAVQQSFDGYPVRPDLILTDLLESDPHTTCKIGKAHIELFPPVSNAPTNMLIHICHYMTPYYV